MNMPIPTNMTAVLLGEQNGSLTIGKIPVPQPGPAQVLVRMAASPINPSDLGFLSGAYGFQKLFPIVPGFEGSGTVVAAGSGLLPRLWMGKRVACAGSEAGGAWAEFQIVRAALCVPLQNHLSLEQAATMLVNPLTVLAFFDIVKRDKHAALVNTAAASALGRMILRLGLRYRVPVINIVRRREQADLLRSLGAEFVLQSDDPTFNQKLRDLMHRLKATLILDAVSGELGRQIMDVAPTGSTAIVYGSLSGKNIEVTIRALSYDRKRVTGFYLPNRLAQKNILQVFWDMQRVQLLMTKELQTTIQKRFPLSAAQQAVELYRRNPTAGKVLLVADSEKIRLDQ
ncbi:MAG: zinc-binding dehydrogenase [Chloroflexota bacterium]